MTEAGSIAPFEAFFDDAAVYPPGNATLNKAIHDHLARRKTLVGRVMGPVILPPSMLEQADQLVAKAGAVPVDVNLVVPGAEACDCADMADRLPHLRLAGLEIKPGAGSDPRDLLSDLARVTNARLILEVTQEHVASGVLGVLRDVGAEAKYRTGGITSELFPSDQELAAFISEAVSRKVPFKLTAGLHEAVRYRNSITGFTHHGFLNIALAVTRAQTGAPVDELTTILASSDQAQLVDDFRPGSDAWRESFTSFGTCSIPEPTSSLERLGLLRHGIAATAKEVEQK